MGVGILVFNKNSDNMRLPWKLGKGMSMYSKASEARLLRHLSNEARLEILAIISERETCVSVIAMRLNMSQSAVSQHLARLRDHGLIVSRREAQTVYYRCGNPGVLRLLEALDEVFSPAFSASYGYPMNAPDYGAV